MRWQKIARDLKFMCYKFGCITKLGYEDMIDNVILQNGTWISSWLSNHRKNWDTVISDQVKSTVKISERKSFAFLR